MYPDPVPPQLPANTSGKSRIMSTVVQLFLAGGFVKLTDAVGADIPADLQVYWTAALTLVLTYAMAWADEQGISYPAQKALGRDKNVE